jgi:hypothetical protein
MSVLKLGIPKGSLEKATIELFEKSGWRIKLARRSYFPEIDDDELACSICSGRCRRPGLLEGEQETDALGRGGAGRFGY